MSTRRKLTVIMFSDIVGYSAAMTQDEATAMRTVSRNVAIHRPLIVQYRGSLLKVMGDGILSSFDSPADAVLCAGAIQSATRKENIQLRIEIINFYQESVSFLLDITFIYMSSCCKELYYDMFDASKAQEDLSDYLRTGYKRSSRPLFKLLDTIEVDGRSLLDVGGGIGAIVFELLERGLVHASHNDISPAYVKVFLEEASRRQLRDHVTSYEGDFTVLHASIPYADIVTLDKVICCYPEFEGLVRQSSAKAIQWYVINLPREHWLVRIGMRIDNRLTKWRTGKAFPTYFHPVSKIVTLLERIGFRRTEQLFQREWTALLFERVSA